jgi:hypothetical protein
MDADTLYYTLSTIPQVIAASTAILAAFTFVRLNTMKDLLIGDGKSVIDRYHKGEYKDFNVKGLYIDRLNDAINRRTIIGIKEVIDEFRAKEIGKNLTKQERPTGFQFVYDRFCSTENRYKKMITWTILAVSVSVL